MKNRITGKILIMLLSFSLTISMSGISSFAASGDTTVYVTKTGKCYHNSGCSSLSKSCIETTLEAATGKYTPCSKCKPPTLDSDTTTTKASTTTKSSTSTKSSSTKKSTSSTKSTTSKSTSTKETTKASVSTQTSTSSDTTSERTVWKSATGSKYHTKNNCGTMNPDKATSMTESDAKAKGLTPCSKCCK
ncbi:MAG: hypothetical protein IKQ44_14595 [Lachnospiraceae bacterium]|nr:hypothetical protein [Lachnospiraceae bacterium]